MNVKSVEEKVRIIRLSISWPVFITALIAMLVLLAPQSQLWVGPLMVVVVFGLELVNLHLIDRVSNLWLRRGLSVLPVVTLSLIFALQLGNTLPWTLAILISAATVLLIFFIFEAIAFVIVWFYRRN